MESQAEEKYQEFYQEVDAVAGKKKRKLSENQLKALAAGRKKKVKRDKFPEQCD